MIAIAAIEWATSTIGTSSSGAGVDLPGAPAEAFASVAMLSVIGEGSTATKGRDAGTGLGANACVRRS
jgi:hypothetical protein